MSKTSLPKDGRCYRIWSIVEELCLDRTSELADASMRGSYYLVREWLDELRREGDITDDEYDYFAGKYDYYRDDLWPRIEANHGVDRPDTKPPTTVIENGREYTESYLSDAWHRTRGFIFLEKAGMIGQLEPLTNHGWLVVASQGESTRTFREWLADDDTDRSVLALTGDDHYGGSIVDTLAGDSRRTDHLDLESQLEGRVIGLGLTIDDAEALDLPKERDETKSPRKYRTELNALMSLRARDGIDDPLLAYTVAKMRQAGIPLCPQPIDESQANRQVRSRIERAVSNALAESIDAVVEEAMTSIDDIDELPGEDEGTGPRMDLLSDRGRESVDLDDVHDELLAIAENRRDGLAWR